MSLNTYFCFCCLSTNDLNNLFNDDVNKNYAKALEDIYSVKYPQDDDGYICIQCCNKLLEAQCFKCLVYQTLEVLKVNGLIKLNKQDNYTVVENVNDVIEADECAELECDLLNLETIENIRPYNEAPQDIAMDIIIEDLNLESEEIKEENIKTEVFDNIEQLEESENNKTQETNKDIEKKSKIKRSKTQKEKDNQNNKANSTKTFYKVNDNLTCDVCSKVLPNLSVYHQHMNEHFPNHVCEICGKGFVSLRRLKCHKPSHNPTPQKCNICKIEFSNYNTLYSHKRNKHSGVMRYKCSACDERFLTFGQKMVHLAEKHGQTEKKYKCSFCPKKFLISGNRSTHIRRAHLKEKKFHCSECNEGFFQKTDLKSHMISHTGVKEYQCSICNKTFPRKNSLVCHMRIHYDDKKFCCDHCGKKFTQKAPLLRHMKVHQTQWENIALKDLQSLYF